MAAARSDSMNYSVVEEEIEVLESIYIDELEIEKNESGQPVSVGLQLHPATGDDHDRKFVCMTLCIQLTEQYPDELPEVIIRNPRGLGEEELQSLHESINELAQERTGGPMLYEIIELAKESLTEGNIPHCPCMVCLEHFQEEDDFTRTECYHYFHCHCLARYISHTLDVLKQEEEDKVKHQASEEEGNKIPCPVCRENITYDLDSLLAAKPLSNDGDKIQISDSVRKWQKKMAAILAVQKEKGGLIDLEQEKNKFLMKSDDILPIPRTDSGSSLETLNKDNKIKETKDNIPKACKDRDRYGNAGKGKRFDEPQAYRQRWKDRLKTGSNDNYDNDPHSDTKRKDRSPRNPNNWPQGDRKGQDKSPRYDAKSSRDHGDERLEGDSRGRNISSGKINDENLQDDEITRPKYRDKGEKYDRGKRNYDTRNDRFYKPPRSNRGFNRDSRGGGRSAGHYRDSQREYTDREERSFSGTERYQETRLQNGSERSFGKNVNERVMEDDKSCKLKNDKEITSKNGCDKNRDCETESNEKSFQTRTEQRSNDVDDQHKNVQYDTSDKPQNRGQNFDGRRGTSRGNGSWQSRRGSGRGNRRSANDYRGANENGYRNQKCNDSQGRQRDDFDRSYRHESGNVENTRIQGEGQSKSYKQNNRSRQDENHHSNKSTENKGEGGGSVRLNGHTDKSPRSENQRKSDEVHKPKTESKGDLQQPRRTGPPGFAVKRPPPGLENVNIINPPKDVKPPPGFCS